MCIDYIQNNWNGFEKMFIELRNNKTLCEDGSDSEMQEDIKTIEYDSTQSALDYTAMEN